MTASIESTAWEALLAFRRAIWFRRRELPHAGAIEPPYRATALSLGKRAIKAACDFLGGDVEAWIELQVEGWPSLQKGPYMSRLCDSGSRERMERALKVRRRLQRGDEDVAKARYCTVESFASRVRADLEKAALEAPPREPDIFKLARVAAWLSPITLAVSPEASLLATSIGNLSQDQFESARRLLSGDARLLAACEDEFRRSPIFSGILVSQKEARASPPPRRG